jgi:2-keto-4-pentenoate hydratase
MNEIAHLLWQARLNGTIVQPGDIQPAPTLENSYAIQAEVTRLSGHATVGFKVGSTSAAAQKRLGTTEPGSGPILAPFLYGSPVRLGIVPAQMPAVEGEIAFRLGHDLPPRDGDYTHDEVRDAINAVAGAIEIVGTRVAGGLADYGRALSTADGGVNIALVVGAWDTDWRRHDLKALEVALCINGAEKDRGPGARALGDPMNVMVWLANQQSIFGRGLKAGEVITTGTCTGIEAIHPGDVIEADFSGLAPVRIEVE